MLFPVAVTVKACYPTLALDRGRYVNLTSVNWSLTDTRGGVSSTRPSTTEETGNFKTFKAKTPHTGGLKKDGRPLTISPGLSPFGVSCSHRGSAQAKGNAGRNRGKAALCARGLGHQLCPAAGDGRGQRIAPHFIHNPRHILGDSARKPRHISNEMGIDYQMPRPPAIGE